MVVPAGSVRGGVRGAVGAYGERVAVEHLLALGWVVLDRNWRCRAGELDVVARDYRHHREGRLEQIRAALAALPETEAATITPEDLAPRIYPGLTCTVARVAVQTVAAHLRHLREG